MTGIVLVVIGLGIGLFCAVGYLAAGQADRMGQTLTGPLLVGGRAGPLLAVAAVSVLVGLGVLVLGGKGYIVSNNPSVHN